MSPLFKKKTSALDKRIARIQEEMDRVNHDLRLLSKFVEKPMRPVDFSRLKSGPPEAAKEPPPSPIRRPPPVMAGRAPVQQPPRPIASPSPPSAETTPVAKPESAGQRASYVRVADGKVSPAVGGARAYDERFADYLASSFQAGRPLRQERRIVRNKVILMAVVVILLLFLALYRFFTL